MANNPFVDPATRVQHAMLCAADAFQYAESKATRGVSEHPDGGLHLMSLMELAGEIRDEAADQTIYASQLVNGVVSELSSTLVELQSELDEVQESDAQLEHARGLVRKALRLVR